MNLKLIALLGLTTDGKSAIRISHREKFQENEKKFTIFEYEPGIKMNFSGPVGREEAESCPSTSPKTT